MGLKSIYEFSLAHWSNKAIWWKHNGSLSMLKFVVMKQLIVKKYVFGNFISKYFELFVPNTRLKSSKDFVIYLNFAIALSWWWLWMLKILGFFLILQLNGRSHFQNFQQNSRNCSNYGKYVWSRMNSVVLEVNAHLFELIFYVCW